MSWEWCQHQGSENYPFYLSPLVHNLSDSHDHRKKRKQNLCLCTACQDTWDIHPSVFTKKVGWLDCGGGWMRERCQNREWQRWWCSGGCSGREPAQPFWQIRRRVKVMSGSLPGHMCCSWGVSYFLWRETIVTKGEGKERGSRQTKRGEGKCLVVCPGKQENCPWTSDVPQMEDFPSVPWAHQHLSGRCRPPLSPIILWFF